MALDPEIQARAYWTVIHLAGYLIFLSLVAGTFDAMRRRRVTATETER